MRELAEKLTSITNWTDRNTCVLFGDGAVNYVLMVVFRDEPTWASTVIEW